MAPADGGTEASKRMHDYLLSKQRKQEEYWLRKYGKVLQTAPPSISKTGNSARAGAGGSNPTSGRSSHGGGLSTESSTAGGGGLLPPIPGASHPAPGPVGALPHHHRQPKGQAPIFHAKEPVRDFFSRNVRQARGAAVPVRDEYGNLPPVAHLPPEPYRKGRPGQLPPLGGERSYAAAGQAPQSEYSAPLLGGEGSEGSQGQQLQQQQSEGSYGSGGSYRSPQQLPPGYKQGQGSTMGGQPQRSPQRGMVGGAFHSRLPPLTHEPSGMRGSHTAPVSSPYQNKPLRNLELELTVIKAVKAREDVLERLRVAGSKLDASFGGAVPVVLSSVDPLVRLFYRLVSSLRQRTLDAVEAIAAWRRKVSPSEPFIYYGVDYLASIGPDASFLDELPFLRSRLSFGRAADDPFLAELTPDGVPIEEATTCDLRRGGQRFSSDALRIRMARKVLAQYCGRPLLHEASGLPSAMPSGLPPIGPGSPGNDLVAEPSQPSRGAAMQDEEPEAAGQQMARLASPPVAKTAVPVLPPLPRAITPPAMSSGAAATAKAFNAAPTASQPDDLEPLEPGEDTEARLEEDAEVQQRRREEEMEDDQAVGDQNAFEQGQEEQFRAPEEGGEPRSAAAQPEPAGQAPVQPNELMVFEDDGDYIDFALGAIIHSLEPPYVDTIVPGTFTVAGWEIDRQLEDVVRGIASPERAARVGASRGRAASPPQPAARMPPSRDGPPAPAAAKPPSRGGRIPGPPASFRPPSRSGAEDATVAKASPRSFSRIPAPPSISSTPAAGSGGDPARPPVRVHLRPGSRGVGMDVSMDGECLEATAAPASAPLPSDPVGTSAETDALEEPAGDSGLASRPPVRVHLRPGSRGVGMGLSMDGEDFGAAAPPGELPAISEERSAYFGAEPEEAPEYADSHTRPPVRVHLKPGSRGVDMGLSMDGEGLGPQAPAEAPQPGFAQEQDMAVADEDGPGSYAAGSRPPVRVHLRPGSQGVGMGLSMDGDLFDAGGPAGRGRGGGPILPVPAESDAEVGTPRAQVLPALEDSPSPLQGSLSARANRASMRSARSSSRPGSAVAASREGLAELPMSLGEDDG